VYRGSGFTDLFTSYSGKSTKPCLISEFGCDSWKSSPGVEDQSDQSTYLASQWGEINAKLNSGCLGGLVFQWHDEWWKAGNNSIHDTTSGWTSAGYLFDTNMNEEWFGVCAISTNSVTDRSARQSYYTLKSLWQTQSILTATINGGSLLTWNGTMTAGTNMWKVAAYPVMVSADVNFSDFLIQIYTDNKASDASPKYTGLTSTTAGKGFNLVGVSSTSSGLAMAWRVTDTPLVLVSTPIWVKNRGDGSEGFTDYQWKWMKDKSQTTASGASNFSSTEEYIRVWDQNGIYWADHVAVDADPNTGGNQPSPASAVSPNYIYVAARLSDSKAQQYKTNKLILEYLIP
jgi:hypothetical protein